MAAAEKARNVSQADALADQIRDFQVAAAERRKVKKLKRGASSLAIRTLVSSAG